MTELRRLLSDPDATSFERRLLESWPDEQPSAAARVRVLALAGILVGGGVAGVASTSAAAGTAAAAGKAGAAGVGSLAPKVASAGIASVIKWALVGALVAGSGAAAYSVADRSTTATSPSEVTAAQPATPAPPRPSVPPGVVAQADVPAAAAPAAPVLAPTAVPKPAAAAPLPAPPRDSLLTEQIALFDRARAALDAGDADRALGLLDTYENRYRNGAFVQEAEVLRVQALLRKGDRAAATRVGQRFLAAHPTSPHAARIRAMLGNP